jgi:hypothetical protein
MVASHELIRLPYPVPYSAQVASPDLADAFFSQGRPLESDPRWAESGAADPSEYAHWADRSCGIACVKMLVEAFGGPQQPMMSWIRAGLGLDGYRVERGADGQLFEVGWVHKALAELIRPYAAACWPEAAGLSEIVAHLRQARALIASVSYEIGTPGPVTRSGGHLVVVTGAELTAGELTALHLHNPSGRTEALRVDARVPVERFLAGFTGRIIVAQPRKSA